MLDAPLNTSAAALHQISNTRRKAVCDMIVSVVTQAQCKGARDMSMREVQAAINEAYGRWIDVSTISGRVTLLVASGQLLRVTAPRPCTVTGATVNALSVPMQQASIPSVQGGYY